MKTTEQQNIQWDNVLFRLDNETTFSKQQVMGICYAMLIQKITIDKRIAILEEVIKLNPKQS